MAGHRIEGTINSDHARHVRNRITSLEADKTLLRSDRLGDKLARFLLLDKVTGQELFMPSMAAVRFLPLS